MLWSVPGKRKRQCERLTDIPVSGGLELKQVQESNILGQWPGRRLGTSLNTTGDHQSQVEVFSVQYLPGTVGKSVEQIWILHIQNLNINLVSFLRKVETSTYGIGF